MSLLFPSGGQSIRASVSASVLPMNIQGLFPLGLAGLILLSKGFQESSALYLKAPVLHIRWPNYWSFSFSISPSNEYSGLISCRTNWLDFFAVQGILKSLPQHHSSEASILWHRTTGKTIALTSWTFVGKAMSLLFSMLSRLHYFAGMRDECIVR